MTNEHKQNNISNDLIEAYKGYYEDDEGRRFWSNGIFQETLYLEWVVLKIKSHSSKERLNVYLEWNGIIGYTSRIWEITQGEL